MTGQARVAGKKGRRSPKRAPALQFSAYYRPGAVPAAPAWVDYLANLSGWQMLGNDAAGDCVAVTWANIRRLVSTTLATGYYPNQAQVWTVYETQNPGFDPAGGDVSGPGSSQDNGMDIQTLLEYLVSDGGPDGVKAVGFAAVDYTSAAEVKAAIDIFGCIWTGINVLDVNMTEFNDGQPWTYSASSADDGGHSVISGGFGDVASDTGQLSGNEKFITWAQETSFTDGFWSHQVEEAWVVIWPEMLKSEEFVAAMDMATFAADYTAITGKPFPAPLPPSPSPTPTPTPSPTPVPPAPAPGGNSVWQNIERWLAQHFDGPAVQEAIAEVEKDFEAKLAEAKATAQAVAEQAAAEIRAAVAKDAPEVAAAVEAAVQKLLAGLA